MLVYFKFCIGPLYGVPIFKRPRDTRIPINPVLRKSLVSQTAVEIVDTEYQFPRSPTYFLSAFYLLSEWRRCLHDDS